MVGLAGFEPAMLAARASALAWLSYNPKGGFPGPAEAGGRLGATGKPKSDARGSGLVHSVAALRRGPWPLPWRLFFLLLARDRRDVPGMRMSGCSPLSRWVCGQRIGGEPMQNTMHTDS